MRVLIDACVLYPTVLRHLVLGAARIGMFTPLWSARILEEWAHATAREGYEAEGRSEIAQLRAQYPAAEVASGQELETRLSLPDPDDIHVLASAIAAGADAILTLNIKDFPTRVLSAHGVLRRHPDEFLLEAYHGVPEMADIVENVFQRARSDGIDLTRRSLLKKSRLPRLAKAVAMAGS